MISIAPSKRYPLPRRFYAFLNVLLFLLRASHCLLPQASQEDLLRSFKSYSDVAMFHYTVPKEVSRATWQFAAFMDDPACQPRKVYIHLRFGSYPIISTNNETFLMNMYTERDYDVVVTTVTTYQPENVTIVPIYGPQPGDWFVGAYMSHWNERVQQQGFGHKCQYSIGTVALWSQIDSIENIPLGYQTTLRSSATTTYYKIYIPSGTWSFRLSIWNCSFMLHTLHDIREPCIESMSLKGRILPIPGHSRSEKFASLATRSSHTFVEFAPYEDSYYYLSIVSHSVIEFNVKVDISECPIRIVEKSFAREYINTALSFNSVNQESNAKDSARHGRYYEDNISDVYSGEHIKDSCMPRHQLVRVKHAAAFSTVYLLQGNEWLSSRLMLTNLVPVMMQFDILPLVDIGGTLDVSTHLELDKLSPKIFISVIMCVQRSRIPKLVERQFCQNGALPMNMSSLDKPNASLLIAYPQPGTWYIIIYATCYDYDKSVHYQLEEISVLLNVRTKKCTFADPSPCGDHGVCREIQKNGLHYATCKCFEDYSGWGCTDASNTAATISSITRATMLILSNIFFAPAIYIAMKRELYAEGLVYLATMLFSSLYHACDQNGGQFCIGKYEVLQYTDFFSSILAFWITLIAMAELPSNFVPLCHMTGVFVITIGVQANKTCLISILIPLSMSIVISIFAHIYRNFRTGRWKKPSRKTLMGLLLAVLGLSLYSFVETEGNYQYVHSVWHVVMATSLIFLLPLKRATSSSRSVSSNDDSDSWSCKEHRGIPMLIIADQKNRTITSS